MRRRLLAIGALAAGAALPGGAAGAELIGVCEEDLCAVSEGGAITRLTTDGAAGAYSSPSVSRDGAVLAYVRAGTPYRGGRRGAGAQPLLETEDAREVAVSPDGRSLMLRTFGASAGEEGFVLESTVLVTGAAGPRSYASTSEAAEPGWSGGQPLLTSAVGDDDRYVVCRPPLAPSGGLPPCGRPVADDPALTLAEPTGTRDGRLIVVQALGLDDSASRIAVYDAQTGAPLRTLSSGPSDSSPSLSPDGTQVAFTRDDDTWTVPLAGGGERLLARGVIEASWGGPLAGDAAPVVPRLRVRGRRAGLRVRCRVAGGCVAETWDLRRGGRLLARFAIPALASGARARVSARLPRRDAIAVSRSGPRGVRASLVGSGPKTRAVRLRRTA